MQNSRSIGSIRSRWSIGSILSIASVGSILSIGSTGSILSIGSAGSIGDEEFTPALKAKQALLKITGYAFPFDVAASLAAWEKARGIADSVRRKGYLVQCLGDGRPPLQAYVVRDRQIGVLITNVSHRPVVLARQPDRIEVRFAGALEDRSDGTKAGFVTLAPRQSLRMPISFDTPDTLASSFLMASPGSR